MRRRVYDAVNLKPLERRAWAWLSWQVVCGRFSLSEADWDTVARSARELRP